MNICDFIGIGKENAVSRKQLHTLTGLDDRDVRKLIQEARDRGELIVNDGSGAGYFVSRDLSALKRQYSTNRSRALSILRQQRHLRRVIRVLEQAEAGQTELEEVVGNGVV